MKVSVIIPFYRVEKWIAACYESLKAQTFKDFEVFFVDDGSDDGSRGVLEDLIGRDSSADRFKVLILERNGGISIARNAGVRASSGEYIFFLDSDDRITPDALEKLVALAEKYPGVDMVQGNCHPHHPSYDWMDISTCGFPEYSADREWIFTQFIHAHYDTSIPVTVWNKLIRRDLFIGENMWFNRGSWHEDEHWRFTNASKIESVAFCFDITYLYTVREGSFMSDKFSSDRSPLTMLSYYKECFPKMPIYNRENIEDIADYLIWAKKPDLIYHPVKYNWAYTKMSLSLAFGKSNFTPGLRKMCFYLALPPFLVSRKKARKMALK